MTTDLHQRLVEDLAGKGLLDNPRLRAAFQAIRREHFLPGVEPERIYHDDAVTTQTGPGGMTTSSSSHPSIMALMLTQLDPQPGDRVLEIGAGTGYNAALLAHLVGPSGQVITIDIDPAITQAAQANLDQAGVGVGASRLAEVEVRTGDGWLGAADRAPFDRIQPPLGCGTSPQPGPTSSPRPGPWSRRCGCAPACMSRPPSPARPAMVDWVVVRSPAATLYACAGRTPAPPIPKDMGWFARLALDEADAIQLLAPGDEDEELRGLFDPSPTNPGLALVLEEERQLAGFGNPASLSRLRAHLIRGESIMFHEVTIEAIPSGAPTLKTASGRGWVIARPTYRFLVFER